MKLGVIGWSGHENFGDERMIYCIRRLFDGADFFVATSWENAREHMSDLNQCDFILIGGGGLILRGANRHVDILEQIQPPFGFFGVSIEANHRDMSDFFEAMCSLARFILLRDAHSQEILNHHPKTIVGPDITFLFPYEVAPDVPEDSCALNLRDWFFWNSELDGWFHRKMVRLDRKYRKLEKYYPFERWRPWRVVRFVRQHFDHVYPFPFYFESGRRNDYGVLSEYFSETPSYFDETLLERVRYLVAMRFHALVFALQRAVPFLSLSYQPKNAMFCRDLGLPQLSVDIYSLKDLPGSLSMLKTERRFLRERFLDIRADYTAEIGRIVRHIRYDHGLAG